MDKIKTKKPKFDFEEREKRKLAKVTELFDRNLDKFAFTGNDRLVREGLMLQLPFQLKASGAKGVENVVIFPYGTFYHGIGYSDDPLTAFVCTGYPITERKAEPKSSGEVDEKEDGELSGESVKEDFEGNTDSRMRQTLLLDINDALISKTNDLQQVCKQVTLTRLGKLYFVYENPQHPASPVECVLEAKSFLQVQASRLIKFYCHLEPIFLVFTKSVLHWARSSDVIQKLGKTEIDGLNQEHIILLVIYFLVRRRVIPSLALLQEWSSAPFYVDSINTAFCEDVEFVKKSCSERGIGASPLKPSLTCTLHLLHEFFMELGTINFIDYGLSPASGTMFVKTTFNKTINFSSQRRLDTKTMLCIQHIFDGCQNTSRKVGEAWIDKFQKNCRDIALKMTPPLWRNHIIKATNIFFDSSADIASD